MRNTEVCRAPWASKAGFDASIVLPGTLMDSYSICMKST